MKRIYLVPSEDFLQKIQPKKSEKILGKAGNSDQKTWKFDMCNICLARVYVYFFWEVNSISSKSSRKKVLLRKNGTPMHDKFDLIIGVTAQTNEIILVTDNIKDFRYIKT